MKLNVKERVSLLNILPKRGSFLEMQIVNDLLQQFSFSTQEIEELNFQEENGSLQWNPDKDEEGDYVISEKARRVIASVLEGLDEKGEVSVELLSLYQKFVETT